MFVKINTGFQKLLDKKPLRSTGFGESKGFRVFKKFMINYRQGDSSSSLKIISLG